MKNKIYTTIIIVSLFVCLVFILINPVSQIINRIYSNGAVTVYDTQVNTLSEDDKDSLFSEAIKYNNNLSVNVSDCFSPEAFDISSDYDNILNVTGDGVMGTITIPSISCNLPIYHGSNERNFDKGAVHMASTAFPIGGKGNHCIISAHTAYPGKIFFDKLTDVECGEYFYIKVLNKTLAYKVSRIDVVLPSQTELLKTIDNEDLVTLITCTPYSINTHRLLVRGQRDLVEEERIKRENININQGSQTKLYLYIFIVIFIIAVIVTGIVIYITARRKERKNESKEDKNEK